jgi:hypothetical protein
MTLWLRLQTGLTVEFQRCKHYLGSCRITLPGALPAYRHASYKVLSFEIGGLAVTDQPAAISHEAKRGDASDGGTVTKEGVLVVR